MNEEIKAAGETDMTGGGERERERVAAEVRKSLTLLLVVWCQGSTSGKTR